MINVLIGIFYVALVALSSYLLYYIIKTAIKDAYYEIEYNDYEDDDKIEYNNTTFDDKTDK